MSGDTDICPACESNVFQSSYEGARVYKCSSPVTMCPLNRKWKEDNPDGTGRTPLGKTKAQVRRVYREFTDSMRLGQ